MSLAVEILPLKPSKPDQRGKSTPMETNPKIDRLDESGVGRHKVYLQVVQGLFRNPQFSGQTELAVSLALTIRRAGSSSSVVSSYFGPRTLSSTAASRVTERGITVFYLGHILAYKNSAIDVFGWSMALRAVLRADVVVVHGLRSWTGTWCAALLSLLGREFWVVPHGMSGWKKGAGHSLKRVFDFFLTGPIIRRATRVLIGSALEAEEVLSAYQPQRSRLAKFPIPSYSIQGNPMFLRSHLKLLEQDHCLLFVGRVSRIKNIEAVITSLGSESELASSHFVVVGPIEDAGYQKELVALVSELSLQERIHFLGPLWDQEKADAIASCDVAIVSSFYENHCHFAFEAYAAGKPLVLSSNTGARETLEGRNDVYIVDPTSRGIALGLIEALKECALTAFDRDGPAELHKDEPMRRAHQ